MTGSSMKDKLTQLQHVAKTLNEAQRNAARRPIEPSETLGVINGAALFKEYSEEHLSQSSTQKKDNDPLDESFQRHWMITDGSGLEADSPSDAGTSVTDVFEATQRELETARETCSCLEDELRRTLKCTPELWGHLWVSLSSTEDAKKEGQRMRDHLQTVEKDATSEAALKEKLKQELVTELLEHVWQELRLELQADVCAELRELERDRVRQQLRLEMQSEAASWLKEELQGMRGSLEAELQDEVWESLRSELEASVKDELRGELATDVLEELRVEFCSKEQKVRTQLRADLACDVVQELRYELRSEVQRKLKEELSADVRAGLRAELSEAVRDDLRQELMESGELMRALMAEAHQAHARQHTGKTFFMAKFSRAWERLENDVLAGSPPPVASQSISPPRPWEPPGVLISGPIT